MREVDLIDSGTKDTIVLVVCQEGENNSVDQALLTLRLYTKYHVLSVYQTHQQLLQSMHVDNGVMMVDNHEVAVVYFRSGYTPADYSSQELWDVRERIECCRAIKAGYMNDE